jgi:hypothetical protein
VQRAQLFFYLGAREERREGEQELLTWELSRKPTRSNMECSTYSISVPVYTVIVFLKAFH